MKNVTLKKGIITFTILVMFIGMGIIPSTGITLVIKSTMIVSNDNTLYVGGSGEGNYSKIQDAIDDANDGDTIFVYDDSSPYYEYLLINKTLNLIGEDKHTTIIDAKHKDDTIEIYKTDNCLIEGFTIRNCQRSGTTYKLAVVEIFQCDYVIIRDNILTIGDITANDWTSAIELDNSTYCTIQDNTIFEDYYKMRTVGVVLHDGSCYNTISGNDISNYAYGVKTTTININLYNKHNIIIGNHIHHNLWGIGIRSDTYNEILNNRIEYNELYGIDNIEAHHTTISGNTISYNGVGREFDCGIMLTWYTRNNYISDNVISNNNPTGIYMLTAINNVVTRNNFIDNWGDSSTSERWWGNAFFNYEMMQWRFRRLNRWGRNYWSEHTGNSPKAIHGDMEMFGLFYFPRLEFDWFPALKPYDIGV